MSALIVLDVSCGPSYLATVGVFFGEAEGEGKGFCDSWGLRAEFFRLRKVFMVVLSWRKLNLPLLCAAFVCVQEGVRLGMADMCCGL